MKLLFFKFKQLKMMELVNRMNDKKRTLFALMEYFCDRSREASAFGARQ